MIIAWAKAGLKKRKVKVFLLFLLCSTLAWLINNLSQTFVSNTTFELVYSEPQEDFLLVQAPKAAVDVRLKAVGFQFIGFGIKKRKVQIDLSKVSGTGTKYYVLPKVYRKQIEDQLPKSMELLEIDNDTLFLDLIALISKEIPVEHSVNIAMVSNYMLEDGIKITPKTVLLRGPKSEIDSITSVKTSYLDMPNVSANFNQKIGLVLPKELNKSSTVPNFVAVSGKVFRFSEKVVSVPVEMINVPDDVKVRMFPDQVDVLCQGKIEALKSIKTEDFSVVADYNQVAAADTNRLTLVLDSLPKNLSKTTLLTKEIEFILRRQ